MVDKERPSMDEYLGEAAKVYEERRGLKRIKIKTTLVALDLLNIPKNSYILDVACGTGWSTGTIDSEDYKVIGIDVSKSMTRIANEKGYDIIIGDMRFMGFKDKTFDGIVSISALNFIAENARSVDEVIDSYNKAAHEVYRVLKMNGRAVIEYYPKTKKEEEISTEAFLSAGFNGELMRNTYKKKLGQRFLNLKKDKKPAESLSIKNIYFHF